MPILLLSNILTPVLEKSFYFGLSLSHTYDRSATTDVSLSLLYVGLYVNELSFYNCRFVVIAFYCIYM